MKVVAFGASTSKNSINKALATYTAKQVEGADVTVLDINDYDVPMFSEDKEVIAAVEVLNNSQQYESILKGN